MNKKKLVFVYGTLRKHEKYHHLLEGATCVAQQSWTDGELFDTDEGYPALKKSDKSKVFGELYLVDDQQLQKLDELENYRGQNKRNLYNRDQQTVFTDIGSHQAYVYTLNPNDANSLKQSINLGDWRVYNILKTDETFSYFAYGSCMDHERFKLAKVDHFFQKQIGVGILDGYQLRYTRKLQDGGRADMVEEGGTVEGIVYEVPKACLAYLFRREGVNSGCYRPAIIAANINGKLVNNILTFLVIDRDEETAPPFHYANEIIRGGTGLLSESYLEKIKQQLRDRFNMSI